MFNQQYHSQNQFQQLPRTNTGINWVQGIEGAKAFQLMPNSNVVLMDSENEKFYIKSSDNIGMCSLRVFNYQEEIETPKSDYATKKELNDIIEILRMNNEQIISRDEPKINTKQHKQSTTPNCVDSVITVVVGGQDVTGSNLSVIVEKE